MPDRVQYRFHLVELTYLQAGVDRVWLIDSHSKSITIFYPDAPPQTKRENDSLQKELLPELELTVQQIFQKAGLI